MIKFYRKIIIQVIWAVGLRGVADKLQFLYLRMKNQGKNALFQRKHPDFLLPPPELVFDAFHTVDWDFYRSSGISDARMIGNLINQFVEGSDISVLEWGCGPGRIIRHLNENLSRSRTVHLYGTDYNRESIAWCARNLQGIQFSDNNLAPPIDFPEKKFNVAYATSIFTHLSEKSITEWLREMNRLLCNQGYFIFSTHGEAASVDLNPVQLQSFRKGNLVVREGDHEGKKLFGTYHPKSWVESVVVRTGFQVKSFDSGVWVTRGGVQDVWVVQKIST